MPKKTAYSRGGGPRTKQKSFELVRPHSDTHVLEASQSSEEADRIESEEAESSEVAGSIASEQSKPQSTAAEEKEPLGKRTSTKVKSPTSISTPVAAPVVSNTPKSAAARMAARRQAAQKSQQRSSANLISAENYGYVRKDLIFILILAILMFAIIIGLHFILGVY